MVSGRSCTTPVGGVDLNRPRSRAAPRATLALACSPDGFTVSRFAAPARAILGKQLVIKLPGSRRYQAPPPALRAIAALVIPREKILGPIPAGAGKPKMGRKPKNRSAIDEHYQSIRRDVFTLFEDLGIAAQQPAKLCRC